MLPKGSDRRAADGHFAMILSHLEGVTDAEKGIIQDARIREMRFDRRNAHLTLVMEPRRALSKKALAGIERAATRAIPNVSVTVEQCGAATAGKVAEAAAKTGVLAHWEAIEKNWQNIVEAIKSSAPHAAPMLYRSRPKVNNESICILCATELTMKRLSALRVTELFKTELESRYNADFSVELGVGQFEMPPPPVIPADMLSKKESLLLLGVAASLQGTPSRIRDLVSPERSVLIEGEVFATEVREVGRPARQVLTFGVTDFDDSVRVKLFDPPVKLAEIKPGDQLRVAGSAAPDKFENDELVVTPRHVERVRLPEREDSADEKRVELNLHTKFSRLNALIEIDGLMARLKRWGWEGFAVTDNAVVQSFPRIFSSAKKAGLKVGLGCQLNLVDDLKPIAWSFDSGGDRSALSLSRAAVVFDLETTGLSATANKVIEIAAFRVEKNRIVGEFKTFVDPREKLPEIVKRITGIDDAMLVGAPSWDDAFAKFRRFVGDAILVAHNITFDAGFIRDKWTAKGKSLPPLLDTLGLSRALNPELRTFTLGAVAKAYSVNLVDAHRADSDARALALIYIEMLLKLKERGVTTLPEVNALGTGRNSKKIRAQSVTALVRNQAGIRNLYQLVTDSHLEHLHRYPRVPASLLAKHREGLLVGSCAVDGPVVEAILANESDDVVDEIALRFDYLEIGPPEIYGDRIVEGVLPSMDGVRELIEAVVAVGNRTRRPVVAVSSAHHLDPHELKARRILRFAIDEKKAETLPSLHLRTTDEMLECLGFLGRETARQVVIVNPKAILRGLETTPPIPAGFFPPVMDNAAERLEESVWQKANECYGVRSGGKLAIPSRIRDAIEKELRPIVQNGFAVLYLIAIQLVRTSMKSGFVVGSRGSVGSSVVAFLTGITEVNPLAPHYRCSKCRSAVFADDIPGLEKYGTGPDLPPRECCGIPMIQDGYSIPFEAFMGFDGTKVPDIDLNFAGEYQAKAMAEIEETFGKSHVFRAGTISTLKQKNAYGFVRKYLEAHVASERRAEIDRLTLALTDVARTTGQHPGGIVIVPRDRDIVEFMPVQSPADKEGVDSITTHFDFHSYEGSLVKVDVLGHDSPSQVRHLHDLTGIDPMTVPLADPRVMSLFSSPNELGLTPAKLGCPVGSLGIPELGTPLLLGILSETKPSTVEHLVRISGLSHGTGVWKGNAQDLIRSGTATLAQVIATREDIMNNLMKQGMPPVRAFAIMESVRKGKQLSDTDEDEMRKHKVPEWVVEACKKIQYLFPRAHAVAYILMALRIAWFKVYRPAAFYASYFSTKVDDLPLDAGLAGLREVNDRLSEIRKKEAAREASAKEQNVGVVLLVLREMLLRGIRCLPVDLGRSDPLKFGIEENAVRPPLIAVEGLGSKMAEKIGPILREEIVRSVEDLVDRTGLSKPVVAKLRQYGALSEMPETNQLQLF